MNKPKILISLPTQHHVEIASDEIDGLRELGYAVGSFPYAAKDGYSSKISRLRVIIENAFNLIKISSKFKPDIIYFNSRVEVKASVRDFITISLYKLFSKHPVKFVIKSHGSDLFVLDSKNFFLSKKVFPFLNKHISGWLFLSTEEVGTVKLTKKLNPEKLFVTKNIIRTDQFHRDPGFKDKWKIKQDARVILFVGRLVKEKGIFELVHGFSRFADDVSSVLLIVGWGEEEDNIKLLAEELKLSNNILFIGQLPEKDVLEFYANSDVLVLPTFANEGFPMALFNSLAAGLAIVTTRIRATKDYLSQPENCIWVEPRKSDSVYDALSTLFREEDLPALMRSNNITLSKQFDKQTVSRELAAILDKIHLSG